MAIPVFTAGRKIRASELAALADPPACIVTRSTAQTGIVSSSPTALTFDTEVKDNDTMFTASSSTITIKTAGSYSVDGYGAIESNATGYRRLLLYVNGSPTIIDERMAVTGDATHMTISTVYKFSANDTVQLYIEQSSGGNRSTAGVPRLAVAYQSA